MKAPRLILLPGIRDAIVGVPDIVGQLGTYHGDPSVHTRRPAPSAANYAMVVMSMAARPNSDGITYFQPEPVVDINVYGKHGAPGSTTDQLREVDDVAERIYVLFHRQQHVLTVPDYSVTRILASGPSPAPTDDEAIVGRRVTLSILLYGKPTT